LAKTSGQGMSGTTPLTFNGPFPETQTAGNSATFITNLIADLTNNMEVGLRFSGPFSPALNTLVASAISALKTVVNTALTPPLAAILSDFVDPLLKALGIGIGEMDVTVLGVGIDPACQECDLSLIKLVDLSNPAVGDTVQFSVIVNNGGQDDATGVAVGDTLPTGFMFISASASAGGYDDGTGVWDIGSIPSGTADTLTVKVKVNPTGEVKNVAQVTLADQPDPDSTPGNDDGDQSEDDEDSATSQPIELPVELADFGAIQTGENEVLLSWSTVSEHDNAGFEIQWLTVAACADGDACQVWTDLAWIDGAGNSNEMRPYSYRLTKIGAGRYRFRLKQIDFDGATELSPAVELLVEMPTTHQLSAAYPNPFNNSTEVDLTLREQGRVVVDVFDALGRNVTQLYNDVVPAYRRTNIKLTATGLPSGTYLIRVSGKTFTEVRRVVLVK
ncbi:MAG: T9SS type A sorting domain-containing protein, partial [Rhodothermales bacterium]